MNMLNNQIGEILAKWNPLGVPDAIACDEYVSYVDPIINIGNNKVELTKYIEHIVSETMGLDYNEANPIHKKEIETIVNKLSRILET